MNVGSARFLLIDGSHDPYWTQILIPVLEPLGSLHIAVECDALAQVHTGSYDLIIIDTSGVASAPRLITQICTKRPRARIIVVTASPTWTRAREAFRAGAIDYTKKSLDPDEIRAVVQSALCKSQPRQPE